ncbi:increased DNA methylation 1 isoform X2 [Ricinus communis]|uniref:increased DNA methylation 1 isoform X2 n=1 Tax=Ricinus communis TaxID=3988 RepID=UPI0007722487|nr:increased DNA methylation 1 isoform X2 [Ricinus communis]|eukprot:XP_015579490.1 increased DNA methylation 1 isoform X2 [Ricinus communis]
MIELSEEEGFQGSWHPGTVMSIDRKGCQLIYHVRYDHILVDDGSDNLVGCYHVSELLDDNDCATGNLCDTRGHIRPLPPRVQSGIWNLCYGRCVDVYYNECWWEGVVFDHEDGSEKRNIFFPDLGDEMMVHIDKIRITQDWNDVTGTWQNRGTWLFLELIEEYEQEHYVPVSIKQLWYDLREKDYFKKLGKWTSYEKDLWKSLVLETIDDNMEVVIHHLLQVIGLPEDAREQVETPVSFYDANKYIESDLAENYAMILAETTPSSSIINSNIPNNCSIEERSIVHQLESLSRNRSKTRDLIKLQNNRKDSWPNRVLRSSERVQQVVVPNPSHRKPITVLSWLIDSTHVLPRAKIKYCCSKGQHSIAEGRISGSGIKCNCCGKVYTLCGFDYHASGKQGRTATSIFSNIFLEDGRSLLDCQMQIMHDHTKNLGEEPLERWQSSKDQVENDHICSVCHYGGELILCDQCPSSFHKSCLGLMDVPDGDWFCSSCCCKICGQCLKRDSDLSMEDDGVLDCTQCERKYHVVCLGNKREECLEYFPKEHWFCSKRCQQIFLGLHELLGKKIPVGLHNLTWTLLKSIQFNDQCEASDIEALSENYSMLNIALDMMHEFFDPVEEPHTKRDLLKDVIFSKRSELNRLNFHGFYTVLLQKDDEFISVATVRVYGEKVAEIPLVGTRFQYRRLGMCCILMNVLEKKLRELGVQRLILPAVPSALNTWIGSFGFSKLTELDRLQLLDYTFLDFQDTIMCHKLLTKIPSVQSSPSREIQPRLDNDASGNGNIVDGSSAVSEVFQAYQIGGFEEYGKLENFAICSSNVREGPINPGLMVNPETEMQCEPQAGEINLESSVEDPSLKKEKGENDNNSNAANMEIRYDSSEELKCYRRRKKSA